MFDTGEQTAVCAECGVEFPGDIDSECPNLGCPRNMGEGATGEGERPAFVIDDAGKADWLLKKLAAVRTEKDLVKAQAAAILAQLDQDEKSLERFLPQLREWGAQELARRGGRRKTLPLFHGSLSYRKVPASLRVADEAAALNHAVEIGAVKVDSAAYRAAALEARKQTGEILPGVEVVPECEHFGIRFGKDNE